MARYKMGCCSLRSVWLISFYVRAEFRSSGMDTPVHDSPVIISLTHRLRGGKGERGEGEGAGLGKSLGLGKRQGSIDG